MAIIVQGLLLHSAVAGKLMDSRRNQGIWSNAHFIPHRDRRQELIPEVLINCNRSCAEDSLLYYMQRKSCFSVYEEKREFSYWKVPPLLCGIDYHV
jgi:hypothetical protein